MPTKIKLLLTFLVVLISSYIFFEHFIARHFLKATTIPKKMATVDVPEIDPSKTALVNVLFVNVCV